MSGPEHAVEPATTADLDRLVECWVALVEHGREHGLGIRAEGNELAARELLAAAVAEDRVLVARRDGRVVGFCLLRLDDGGLRRDATRGVVEDLYVEPPAREQGVGTSLVVAAERRLATLGAEVVSVEAMAADEEAVRFYEDLGYRPRRVTYEKRVESDR